MYYLSYTLWDQFREVPWQRIVRRALAPLTLGLVVASGYVMGRAGDADRASAAITAGAVALTLRTRLTPLWILIAGGAQSPLISVRQAKAQPLPASVRLWPFTTATVRFAVAMGASYRLPYRL